MMERSDEGDDPVREYMESNRRNWNQRTPIHAKSDFYDVEGFKAGRSTLTSIEREELGDGGGRLLLHLQCHFGLDTMSWARLGANVTGVDFSGEAIGLARSLSRELGIEARFVLSNVYDLPDVMEEKYDIVFTSQGVLCWLPDLPRWAEVIAHFLGPGGVFYIIDSHPFGNVLYDEDDATDLSPYYRYSDPANDPMECPPGPTYTDGSPKLSSRTYEWNHSVGDILNSLISAGLTIKFFHEFHFSGYRALPMMERDDDGWWRLPEGQDSVPLLFSAKATK